jgi:2-methylisocitrate lyase-like PEP mutase family enzyme
MTDSAVKAEVLRSFHVPGSPLILTNVWDVASALAVAEAQGTRALATASHSISNSRGVPDGEGMTIDEALSVAKSIIDAVDLPVSVDFERGYGRSPDEIEANILRLIETGAAGLNLEDSSGPNPGEVFDFADQVSRVEAVRKAADRTGVPIVLNARVDVLRRGGEWSDAIQRANAYLQAGADVAFVLGLDDEALVARAVDEIDGPVATIVKTGSVPIARLAELGIARISVGPGAQAYAYRQLAHLAGTLNDRGEYPDELTF